MNYHINATAPDPITESPKIDARDDDYDGCFTAPRTAGEDFVISQGNCLKTNYSISKTCNNKKSQGQSHYNYLHHDSCTVKTSQSSDNSLSTDEVDQNHTAVDDYAQFYLPERLNFRERTEARKVALAACLERAGTATAGISMDKRKPFCSTVGTTGHSRSGTRKSRVSKESSNLAVHKPSRISHEKSHRDGRKPYFSAVRYPHERSEENRTTLIIEKNPTKRSGRPHDGRKPFCSVVGSSNSSRKSNDHSKILRSQAAANRTQGVVGRAVVLKKPSATSSTFDRLYGSSKDKQADGRSRREEIRKKHELNELYRSGAMCKKVKKVSPERGSEVYYRGMMHLLKKERMAAQSAFLEEPYETRLNLPQVYRYYLSLKQLPSAR